MKMASTAEVRGDELAQLLKKLGALKRTLSATIRDLRIAHGAASPSRAAASPSFGSRETAAATTILRAMGSHARTPSPAPTHPTILYCEALQSQIDDLEAVLYTELRPRVIGIDDDGSGQLVLGGRVVARVVTGTAAATAAAAPSAAPAPASTKAAASASKPSCAASVGGGAISTDSQPPPSLAANVRPNLAIQVPALRPAELSSTDAAIADAALFNA